MSEDSAARRCPRIFAFAAVLLCLAFASLQVRAQALVEDAPVLISETDSIRAYAKTAKRGRIQNAHIVQPGSNTRVTFYVTNLDLLPDEGANAFRADAEDGKHYRYPLEVLSLEPMSDRPWVYALTVRLHNAIGDVGDVLVRVNWRGMASNRVRLSIGHVGDGLKDDEGAVPTPMPDKPITKNTPSEDFVGLPFTGDRVRFMEQATFGLTPLLETRLRRISYSTWIAEQMQQQYDASGNPRYSTFPYPNLPQMSANMMLGCPNNNAACIRDNYSMYPLQRWFFREALYGDDQQLRRRVSWALSQIWVVSGRDTIQPSRMLPYIQILDKHAFGNYRDLMADMTLNPAMGQYLDMAISTRQSPNENYAREILQLFAVGLDMLNQDGTPMLDSQGNRIPTYDQAIVNGFTKVFTGWTYCNSGCPNSQTGIVNYRDPMVLVVNNHDTGAKQVLSYPGAISTIPAGQSAEQDFNQALDNIFHHPNVGPFVGKLLIQQLVTSNPTPAYISRVAAAFNNNGQGVRGDLKAVVRAVLLDPEARGNIKTDPDYGKLREPVLFATNLLRPLNPTAQANAVTTANCNGLSDGMINGFTSVIDQDVFNAPSVFNYYQMDYLLPNTDLSAPEFAILTTGTALKRPNFVNQMIGPGAGGATGIPVFNNTLSPTYTPCGTRVSLDRYQPLAQSDLSGQLLVDTLNRELMHSAMSSAMRNEILTAVQAVSSTNPLKRTQTAVYLITTSSQYQVQR